MAVWLAALAACLAASLTGCQLAPRAGPVSRPCVYRRAGGKAGRGHATGPKNGGHRHGGFLGSRPGGPALSLSSLKPPLEQREAGSQPRAAHPSFLPRAFLCLGQVGRADRADRRGANFTWELAVGALLPLTGTQSERPLLTICKAAVERGLRLPVCLEQLGVQGMHPSLEGAALEHLAQSRTCLSSPRPSGPCAHPR